LLHVDRVTFSRDVRSRNCSSMQYSHTPYREADRIRSNALSKILNLVPPMHTHVLYM
jgi:hypothetical protein